MAITKQVNIRVPIDVIAKYQELADRADDRDRSYFMKKALIKFVETKQVKAVPVKTVAVKSEAGEIIDYLNLKAGTNYKHSKASQDCIGPRLKDFTINDCKTVIDKKCAEWLGTDMAKYLRPATLFQSKKFEGYLNQISGTADTREQELDNWVTGGEVFNNGETIEHGHY